MEGKGNGRPLFKERGADGVERASPSLYNVSCYTLISEFKMLSHISTLSRFLALQVGRSRRGNAWLVGLQIACTVLLIGSGTVAVVGLAIDTQIGERSSWLRDSICLDVKWWKCTKSGVGVCKLSAPAADGGRVLTCPAGTTVSLRDSEVGMQGSETSAKDLCKTYCMSEPNGVATSPAAPVFLPPPPPPTTTPTTPTMPIAPAPSAPTTPATGGVLASVQAGEQASRDDDDDDDVRQAENSIKSAGPRRRRL